MLINCAAEDNWRDKIDPIKKRAKLIFKAVSFFKFLLGMGLEGRLILSVSMSKTSLIAFAAAVYDITIKTIKPNILVSSRLSNIAAATTIAKPEMSTFKGRVSIK